MSTVAGDRHSEDSVPVVRIRDESAFAPPLMRPDVLVPSRRLTCQFGQKPAGGVTLNLWGRPGDRYRCASFPVQALPPLRAVLRYVHPMLIVGGAYDVSAAGSDRPVLQSLRRSMGPLSIPLNVQGCRKPRGMSIAALHKKCFPNGQKTSIVLAADAFGGFLPVPPQQLFPSGGL